MGQPSQAPRTIKVEANAGDIVEIKWFQEDGTILVQNHTINPTVKPVMRVAEKM